MYSLRLNLFLWLACLGFSASLYAQQPIGKERGTRESHPVVQADGSLLFFARQSHPRNLGDKDLADIWYRPIYADGSFGTAINPGAPLNSFGADRPLSMSPDGKRFAVLRLSGPTVYPTGSARRAGRMGSEGGVAYIDILERDGRNWRILNSWPLPDEARSGELTFNANSQRLIYARATADGSYDLYTRTALAEGRWSSPEPLHLLNSDASERHPVLAADGRTLYFRRRNGQWYRQDDRGLQAVPVEVPSRYLQFSAALDARVVVASSDDLGNDERLYGVELDPLSLPRPGKLHLGSLGNPPAPGEYTVEVPLSSNTAVEVRPDVLKRYAVVVRDGETPFPGTELPTAPREAVSSGSLAGNSLATTPPANPEAYVREQLADKERALAALDVERQKYYHGQAPVADPELTALRGRFARANGDTLPPANVQDPTRARLAQELAELERMKAQFRRQQEARLNPQTSRPAPTPAPTTYQGARGIDTTTYRRADARPTPPSYDNQGWENRLRNDLPRSEPVDSREAARLDAEYERRLREADALREQLRRYDTYETGTTDPYRQPDRDYTARSPYPATPAPPYPIYFLPNTSYFTADGYAGADALIELVRRAATVVDIRVHAPSDMTARDAQFLSEERAATIRRYLVDRGISPENFRVMGYGNNFGGEERVEIVR